MGTIRGPTYSRTPKGKSGGAYYPSSPHNFTTLSDEVPMRRGLPDGVVFAPHYFPEERRTK